MYKSEDGIYYLTSEEWQNNKKDILSASNYNTRHKQRLINFFTK